MTSADAKGDKDFTAREIAAARQRARQIIELCQQGRGPTAFLDVIALRSQIGKDRARRLLGTYANQFDYLLQ